MSADNRSDVRNSTDYDVSYPSSLHIHPDRASCLPLHKVLLSRHEWPKWNSYEDSSSNPSARQSRDSTENLSPHLREYRQDRSSSPYHAVGVRNSDGSYPYWKRYSAADNSSSGLSQISSIWICSSILWRVPKLCKREHNYKTTPHASPFHFHKQWYCPGYAVSYGYSSW